LSDRYAPREIEPKWQRFWQAHRLFRALGPGEPGFDPEKPKYYVLGMFPYPSGSGLHVGHPLSYTAVDILARYKRMRGFNVLNPIGWDSFGLPAEQYAVKTGFPPAATTLNSINIFRRQLMSLGYSYDWDRESATSDPEYYKWTQWIFLKLFNKGLAYSAEAAVWWCEKLGTVLANEEVDENGLSEIGHHPCVRLPLKQWFLKITEYAERLLDGLETVRWPDHIKGMQRNWIGRSTGADLAFVVDLGGGERETLSVFTTRPDTIFGATYMVMAPEHPLVDRIASPAQKKAVEEYREVTARRSERSRIAGLEKTGVWTGGYAVNPANGAPVPIWISDYVLLSYGTGAIMGVPAHDERDFDFAMEFHLPMTTVVQPPDPESKEIVRRAVRDGQELTCFVGDGTAVNSTPIDGLATPKAKEAMIAWLAARGTARPVVRYKLRDWLFSRQRYWGEPLPLLHTPVGEVRAVPESELPVMLPPQREFKPSGTPEPPLARNAAWVHTTLADGTEAERETNVMPQWAGSCWYYLRFLDAHNPECPWSAEKEKYWMPVDMYIGGAEHAVLHLLYARFWHKFLHDQGLVSTSEPFQQLFNQGMILGLAYKTKAGSFLAARDVRFEGESAFHPETGEPLERVVVKMSKSLGNVVNPDDIVQEHGADTLRLFLMNLGPLEVDKPWDTRAIVGVNRFLHRAWRLIVGEEESHYDTPCRPRLLEDGEEGNDGVERVLQKTISRVESDIQRLSFNTAVSHLIIFVNEALKEPDALTRSQAGRFIRILSPFAPHIAEELWLRTGHTEYLSREPWPEVDAALLRDEVRQVPVQVNGKHRATIGVPVDSTEDQVLEAARSNPAVMKYLSGKSIAKRIYVPGRILNLVVR
jgi:leucyl-tRNA synthetase